MAPLNRKFVNVFIPPKSLTLKSETKFDDFLLHDPDFFSKTAFGYITRYVNQYTENIQ